MKIEIWQNLRSLESQDIVKKWFQKIHNQKQNSKRANEICAAARQAREFFRNADNSDQSVRPLLTYYGVASLSRALVLLLKKNGGEESLSQGHGLQTIGWSDVLHAGLGNGKKTLEKLEVQSCKGLFLELLAATKNRMPMHVHTSSVDWRLHYDIPEPKRNFGFIETLARLPDLRIDHDILGMTKKYALASELKFSSEAGFQAKLHAPSFDVLKSDYENRGYSVIINGDNCILSSSFENFQKNKVQFLESHLEKTFGVFPQIHIIAPFDSESNYSQIGVTFIGAYFLGMMARYFPTYWINLIKGGNGDEIWPMLNRAQQLVETSFPDLVYEIIFDVLANPLTE